MRWFAGTLFALLTLWSPATAWADWPQEARQELNDACASQGNTPGVCACIVDFVATHVPHAEVVSGRMRITGALRAALDACALVDQPAPFSLRDHVWTPLNISVWDPVALFGWVSPRLVAPLSVNLALGRDDVVIGAQLGAGYQVVEDWLVGVQLAPVNRLGRHVTDSHARGVGVQAGILNTGRVYGVQGAVLNLGHCHGVCVGLAMSEYRYAGGLLAGLSNTVHFDMTGWVFGLVNHQGTHWLLPAPSVGDDALPKAARFARMSGLMVGVYNDVSNMDGL